MKKYSDLIKEIKNSENFKNSSWESINPEYVARMQLQNRFKSGIEIAKYNAAIMRKDMDDYDSDSSKYTQSLGCWHGFIGQQKLISIKKHFDTNDKKYLYLSGWMIAALRSQFGPLPDQSMHEKTSVASLINELYTFLRQADARELGGLFRELDEASDENDRKEIINKIDNFQTHVVPIIADIDAGFGNEEATYLMAKQMIEAGACAIQIENQVSDEKQCGHQDGKVTVPHAEFLAKINAVRYAFLELGVDDGVIVARTDSLGAGLTAKIAITKEVGDLGDQYNSFLDTEEVNETDIKHGDVMINHHGKIVRPKRLPSNLYKFKEGTGEARCILDSITSLQSGADLIWIETEKPHIGQIAEMMNEIKKVVPNAKLVYNNSPSFNWTLNFRQQVFDAWEQEGKDVTQYEKDDLMAEKYDSTELAIEADEKIRTFQADAAKEAGIFHHLITLPTYHTAALSTDNLAKAYFGDDGMLGYVKNVQRQEIRQGIACVKHQNMAGSDMGDDHKEYFAGEAALKAAGKDNTMNQF
jgi:isocitrate lyase|tara:strand:- start:985 stop:2568 length:1584 start_codon:yes stop_codon:yes gene_type:complete